MRAFLSCIAVIFVLSGCDKKNIGAEKPEDFGDVIYTDSFSPISYEYPLSRKIIPIEDTDIGITINPDTTNPLYRAVYKTVSDLFKELSSGNDISLYFTESAFNSFRLRYRSDKIGSRYTLLVGEPQENGVGVLSIKFKMVTDKKKIKGIIELTKKDENYVVSDFENTGFDELFSITE